MGRGPPRRAASQAGPLGRCAQFGTLRIVGVALAVARTAAISDIPAGLANCHSLVMDRDDSPRTYVVRAINPQLEPPGVEEHFPTAEAADARAKQLYAAGYDVAVIYSLTHKGDRARAGA
jgi:hypothetical protein